MRKLIFNIDSFIIGYFKAITEFTISKGFFVSILGLLLVIISIIIFMLPMVILGVIYNVFIDRNELIKEYEKKAVKK